MLIFETKNWVRSKAHKIRLVVGAAIFAMCVCLTTGCSVNNSIERNPPIDADELQGCTVIPGADKIYPTIMVDGSLYEWRFGVALVDELTVGSTYYGKIKQTNGTMPENNCEFVSVFSASGRIFVDPNDNLVFLELTTDWLEKQLVVFEPISVSERYQYNMGVPQD